MLEGLVEWGDSVACGRARHNSISSVVGESSSAMIVPLESPAALGHRCSDDSAAGEPGLTKRDRKAKSI